ncbi:MOSC domain-containing protein [Hymenobacter taeanensis]|uniref:MOSC domain-containing protein n=1 Tax=Hymenobacter taeanensis TaxID=2735321 RepID=A0A6M6BCL5_9BACT|nr:MULTISPECIES: MOSC domain-containing protein [Hymenobacter]QJX45534.1 MOSC domain-containing protein [Hymenobacter taeanensis]UOQ81218.1 MOSC domain-containing protein [Hymenobacter sp. 5414T-23]
MQLLSLNIGLPQEYSWKGKPVRTSIFKQPTTEPVYVHTEHLAGDGQADLRVHGGPNKAVYSYPQEHYAFWQNHLGGEELAAGAFGENLTTTGLLEDQVRVGDCYQIGTAVLMAVQPRQPCFKLGLRFQNDQMIRDFEQAGRSGIYFQVQKEGTVQAGDTITLVQQSPYAVTIQDLTDSLSPGPKNARKLEAMLEAPHLTPSWRERLTRLLV